MIGWALRWVLLCCAIVLIGIGLSERGALVPRDRTTRTGPSDSVTAVAPNTIVYRADNRGHVIVDAFVNSSPVRMLVDTGASLVTLTPRDARAAGIVASELAYNRRVSTANGMVRMAPVTLREIRVDQLSLYDVPAAVIENLDISLLGMSFLSRLQGYEMRDGKLTISW